MERKSKGIYTPEFRAEAVNLVGSTGMSLARAAKQLSIPKSSLDSWIRAARDGKLADVGKRQRLPGGLELELARPQESNSKRPMPEAKNEPCKISANDSAHNAFPVVGIGASAGGLEACKQFFCAMPADTGLAFVLVQHLDPNHESLMADLLAKYTKMPVAQALDGMRAEPNHLYVIPPNYYLSIRAGVLHLGPPTERRGMRMPIDHFFRALAEERGEKAICVILSGTGSDGTQGLREIKGHGGMTMVQEPSTAQYDGMPQSALTTGLVDYCLAVEAMAPVLTRYVQHPYVSGEPAPEPDVAKPLDDLSAVLGVVRARTGHDFRHYKRGTLGRRVARRMGLSTLVSLRDYLELLRGSEEEARKLVRDLLIGVTSFFRETKAFEMLISTIAPAIVERARGEYPVRIWVPGCASGEEAYSLAMVFMEAIRRSGKRVSLQIFATDIDSEALEIARAGIYPVSATADLPSEYVQQFFVREGEHVSVIKPVRESVVFAVQNLITDPPFSRLDLVSCRNLLIYLDNEVQAKVIRLFHFALRENGYLFLGSSETIGLRTDMFRTISKKWRIYHRLQTPSDARGTDYYPLVSDAAVITPRTAGDRVRGPVGRRLGERVEEKLLGEYAPAAVLVDRNGEALYFHGATSNYLGMPTGSATHDVVSLAREPLRMTLRAALQRAMREKMKIEARQVAVGDRGNERKVTIKVWPLDENEGTFLVCFEDDDEPGPASQPRASEEALVTQLEYELKATREDLQTTIEEVETTNEELKAANEEVMSMNEELQSTNEELETSKEELQSLNEELSTVNNQLLDKVQELESANNDLANLLTRTDIATIFLDLELRIRRYTPTATRMFALIDADHGRPIVDVARRFSDGDLSEHCRQVLAELKTFQEEVLGSDGSWFLLRILPYRTSDNRIGGVVITFSDISEIKAAYAEARTRESQLRIVADAMPALIAHVDLEHRFRFVNAAYENWFGVPPQRILGEPLCKVFGTLAYGNLCPHLQQAMGGKTVTASAQVVHCRLGQREVTEIWIPEFGPGGRVAGFFSLIQDVTEQRLAERKLVAADMVFRNTTEAAAILDQEGRFVTVNPAFEQVTGYPFTQVEGDGWDLLLAERHAPEPFESIDKSMNTGKGWRGEATLRRKGGGVFAAWMSINPVQPRGSEVDGFVVIVADISTVKEAERRLEYLAHHDPLTGLSNRVMFQERVAQLISHAGRHEKVVGLLYLDLDGFKHVNDSFGHEVGDKVLVLAARRLEECMRAEDTLARLGGDEFGVVLEDVTEPWGVNLVAEKIIEGLRAPFEVEGQTLVLGVSIGISLYPSDGKHAPILIRNADTAMYRAKERGGNISHFYTPALTEAVQQRLSTESALRQAIVEGELELYFQPIMEIASERIVAAEALLRWRTRDRGLILPESFLPVAEMSGLIIQVGVHVIELACKALAQWREQSLPVPRLSLNVSARQCMDDEFPEVVAQALASFDIPAASVDFEITESSFLDKGTSRKVLAALRGLGLSLTIDDFGTGYATLASLRNIPVSAIKIDRAFIDDIGNSSGDDAIASAVIALGKSQNLRVIAEGVETMAQLEALRALGCDDCQGYLIAPPMSAKAFASWWQKNGERMVEANPAD